jgi:hypothetical protein
MVTDTLELDEEDIHNERPSYVVSLIQVTTSESWMNSTWMCLTCSKLTRIADGTLSTSPKRSCRITPSVSCVASQLPRLQRNASGIISGKAATRQSSYLKSNISR